MCVCVCERARRGRDDDEEKSMTLSFGERSRQKEYAVSAEQRRDQAGKNWDFHVRNVNTPTHALTNGEILVHKIKWNLAK